jgi:hypothetical protein
MAALALRLDAAAPWRRIQKPMWRAIAGGTALGLAVAGGLLALTYQGCGAICAADALVTATVTMIAGIATVAPAAILSPRG